MKIVLFCFLLLFPSLLFSQKVFNGSGDLDNNNSGSKKLDLKNEEDIFQQHLSQYIPWKEKYRYKDFQEGYLFYLSQEKSDSLQLNYNLLFRQIVVINEPDTFVVADFEIIKYILIKDDLYYKDYQKGCFEIRSDPNHTVRLLAQRRLNILKRENLRDEEKPKLHSTEESFSVLYDPVNPIFPREKVTLRHDISFYLLDENENTFTATRSNFMKLFPGHQKMIKRYLRQMHLKQAGIKFYREDDLKKLLAFCLSLR